MPLFDPNNPSSAEGRALWNLADLLAECEHAQRLAEETGGTDEENKTATRARIIVGPHAGAWDGDQFTIEEMGERFLEFQLYAPLQGPKAVLLSDASFDRGDETSDFHLITRRYVRPGELEEGRSDVYLWFLDEIGALEAELIAKSQLRDCPILQAVSREAGPAFGEKSEEEAQGVYIFARHAIKWGDSRGSE